MEPQAESSMQSIHRIRGLLPQLNQTVSNFTHSSQAFRIVHTLPAAKPISAPKTLLILDSSFNPPTNAHLSLALSTLSKPSERYPGPYRLLLLLSTSNADKAPSPASFEHRLALMIMLAVDLRLLNEKAKEIDIDIGLTKEPYYTNKSFAIATAAKSGEVKEYPPEVDQVHLMGYDTLIRFLDPKYYKSFNPPLSALESFFESGYGAICTKRAASQSGDFSDLVAEQEAYLEDLRAGKLEKEGFKPAWAKNLAMVEASSEAEGVSSTLVRKAAKSKDWDAVKKMCSEGISEWIRSEALYD